MGPFRLIASLLRMLFGRRRPPESHQDPLAGVREPRRRGPRRPESAIALMEPESPQDLDVRGHGFDE